MHHFPRISMRLSEDGAIGLVRERQTALIWMISACPRDTRDVSAKSRCESGFSLSKVESAQALLNARPVYTTDGKVFKNRYCAECHGLRGSALKVYGVSFGCDFTAPESMTNGEKLDFLVSRCDEKISWVIPSGSPRRMCFYLEKSCFDASNCDNRCSTGNVGIVYEGFNYKNSFCPSWESSPLCGPQEIPVGGSTASFSIIFNFGTNDRSISSIRCEENLVYNPLTEMCESGFLSSPPRSSSFDKYRVTLWILIMSADYGTTWKNAFASILYRTFSGNWKFTNIETIQRQGYWYMMFDAELTKQNRRINRRDVTAAISFERVLHFTSPFNMTINGTECEVFKAMARVISCSDLRKYEKSEYATLVTPTGSVYINASGEVLRARDYYTNGTNVTIGPIYVCHAGRHKVSNCSGVFLKVEHFIIFPNRSIYVNVSGRMLNQSEYFAHNGTTYVCTYLPPWHEKTWADDPALSWLTLVCMLLSIAGLVFFLVTYLLFSELRTIPGVNLMNLALSTLLAQVTWLIGINQTDKTITCITVAALLQPGVIYVDVNNRV
ncbi:uncharacterized protein LOC116611726 [Nematostella vectensis]|uniref:uncharacterized protein LOC116611726 n=1 Tax=Nematostella vectensis TaxID=45351 RepID=UPI00138FF5D3|nr:uncharacterized protein LOC116611726 [Nematostella vectensis]